MNQSESSPSQEYGVSVVPGVAADPDPPGAPIAVGIEEPNVVRAGA